MCAPVGNYIQLTKASPAGTICGEFAIITSRFVNDEKARENRITLAIYSSQSTFNKMKSGIKKQDNIACTFADYVDRNYRTVLEKWLYPPDIEGLSRMSTVCFWWLIVTALLYSISNSKSHSNSTHVEFTIFFHSLLFFFLYRTLVHAAFFLYHTLHNPAGPRKNRTQTQTHALCTRLCGPCSKRRRFIYSDQVIPQGRSKYIGRRRRGRRRRTCCA